MLTMAQVQVLKHVCDFTHIIRFFGLTKDPQSQRPCMVMQYCANGSLAAYLKNHFSSLDWPNGKMRLSQEIASGLQFLHVAGYFHRDLHSHNILIDERHTALLTDFGLSQSAQETTKTTGPVIGMLPYVAPERLKN